MTFSAPQYAQLYIDEIVKLHGVLVLIISNRGLHLSSGELFKNGWSIRENDSDP